MSSNLSAIWLQNKSPLEISTKFASLCSCSKFYKEIPQKNYAAHWQNWTLAKIFWHMPTAPSL